MPKISRSILKGVFTANALKKSVAVTLISFGAIVCLLMVGGLLVPQSTLQRLSKVSQNSPGALTGQATQKSTDVGSKKTADTSTTGATGTTATEPATQPTTASAANGGSTPTAGTSGGTTTGSGGGTTLPPVSSGGGSTPTTPTTVAPSLTFNASPTTITSGATSLLSWTIAAGANPTPTCTASGGWSGSKGTSGSLNVTPSSTTTYTLSCSNSAGTSPKSVTITVNAPVAGCGSGGPCSLSNVSSHSSASDCWMIVSYTGSGGNGTGKVYKIASSFFGGSGTHAGLPSAPSLAAGSWCGKNISSTFNSKHTGGTRSDGTNTAIWWLTNNGNSYIADWSGN